MKKFVRFFCRKTEGASKNSDKIKQNFSIMQECFKNDTFQARELHRECIVQTSVRSRKSLTVE